jgi:putative transcriptional regulator
MKHACRHAPDLDLLLMEYASGTLDQAFSLVMASFVTMSPAARRHVERCEALGGMLMQHLCDPVSMNEQSLEAVLRRLDGCGAETNPCPDAAPAQALPEAERLPAPLRRHMQEQKTCRRKWKTVLPGLAVIDLPTPGCRHRALLAKAAPGTRVPPHRHLGMEISLVLQGGFSDEHGSYRAGDLVLYEAGICHSPVAHPEEGCLALVASAAPIRFTGFFFRIFNILH